MNLTSMSTTMTFPEVLEAAGVTDPEGLRSDLVTVCGTSAEGATFRVGTLALSQVAGWVCSPEDYLIDGDEEGYEKVIVLSDAYAAGENVPGIVYGWLAGVPDCIQVLDGMHRVTAAHAAGISHLVAYEVVA